jgi:hypothetical protein
MKVPDKYAENPQQVAHCRKAAAKCKCGTTARQDFDRGQ